MNKITLNRIIGMTFLLVSVFILATPAQAQRDTPPPHIFIYVENNPNPMTPITSQTEQKKGWDIQGISIGGKFMRYFWNKEARQWTDGQPQFAIYPRQGETLNDYALIRLNQRRSYRRLPVADLKECTYKRINIESFVIGNLPNMGFAVTPKEKLFPGEYILVHLEQTPVNEQGDIIAYDFSVREK